MTSSKSTKRALLTSALAIVLCVTMLIGTTFAWFTDTASTGVNRIVSGNLDIELSYKNKDTEAFKKADANTPVFKEGALWEPGYVEYVVLKLSNAGSLAFKYKLGINIAGETGSTNVNGDAFKLSDYIRFAVLDGDKSGLNRDALVAAAADSKLIKEGYSAEAHLLAGENNSEKIVTLVVWMPTTVGNEANHVKEVAAPSIDLGINVVATQYTYEKDSFGDQYDKDATCPVLAADKGVFIKSETFSNGFLQKDAHVILTDDVDLENTSIQLLIENTQLLLDLNGHKLTVPQIFLRVASEVEISDSVGTGEIHFTSQNGIQPAYKGAKVTLNGGTLYASSTYPIYSFRPDKTGTVVMLSSPDTSFVMNGGKIIADNDRNDAPDGSMAVRMYSSNTTFIMNGGEIEKTVGTLAAIQASGDGNTKNTKIEINGGSIKSNTVAIYHPQSGSLSVTGGCIAGETAIYAKSGTLTFAGGEMHATAATATDYKFNGNGCYTTGDAVVIDACGYPGGNPVVTVTGGKYTVTAEGAHGFAYYKYNENAATITNKAGIVIYEK